MRASIAASLMAAALAMPGLGQAAVKKAAPKSATDAVDLKISFKIRLDAVESDGSFVTASGTQNNFVLGGTTPVSADDGKSIVQKKYGTIVNCLPQLVGKSKANVQTQIELSRPLDHGSVKTMQYQGEFNVPLGQWVVLVEGSDRHVEMKIEELAK